MGRFRYGYLRDIFTKPKDEDQRRLEAVRAAPRYQTFAQVALIESPIRDEKLPIRSPPPAPTNAPKPITNPAQEPEKSIVTYRQPSLAGRLSLEEQVTVGAKIEEDLKEATRIFPRKKGPRVAAMIAAASAMSCLFAGAVFGFSFSFVSVTIIMTAYAFVRQGNEKKVVKDTLQKTKELLLSGKITDEGTQERLVAMLADEKSGEAEQTMKEIYESSTITSKAAIEALQFRLGIRTRVAEDGSHAKDARETTEHEASREVGPANEART